MFKGDQIVSQFSQGCGSPLMNFNRQMFQSHYPENDFKYFVSFIFNILHFIALQIFMLVRLFLRTLTMPWNAFIARQRKMENTSFANIRLTCSTKRICGGGNVEQWWPTQCSSESNYREFRGRALQRSALFCSLHSARCPEWYRALWPALWCGICWASTWWVGWWWWFWSALCASSCNWATLLVRAERANWCWHHFIEDYIAISGKYLLKAPISIFLENRIVLILKRRSRADNLWAAWRILNLIGWRFLVCLFSSSHCSHSQEEIDSWKP